MLSVLVIIVVAATTTSLRGDQAGLAMVCADVCALVIFASGVVAAARRAGTGMALLMVGLAGPAWLTLVFVNFVLFNR